MDLFVLGSARSGTTHLASRVRELFEISMAPETHFFSTVLRNHVEAASLAQSNPRALLEAIKAVPLLQGLAFSDDVFIDTLTSGSTTLWPSANCFNALCLSLTTDDNAEAIGEKTPQHLRYAGLLGKAYPKARFVIVIRDPRSVVASRKRAGWAVKDTATIALHWISDYKLAVKAVRSLGHRCFLVGFEDAIVEAPTVNAELARFTGLAPRHSTQPTSELAASWETWKMSTSSIPDISRTETWKDLPEREIAMVEMICWREMQNRGYQTVNRKRPMVKPTMAEARSALGLLRGETQHTRHHMRLIAELDSFLRAPAST